VVADLEAAKRELRRRLVRQRRGVQPPEALAAGRAVLGHLEGTPEFSRAERVVLYAALADELPTRPCFEALRARGAEVLLPRMAGARELVFCALEDWEQLTPGRHGVPEPPLSAPERPAETAELALLPGVAFDVRGHRLGRGGGFYDAAFPVGRPGPRLLGVGFELQVVGSVPAGSRDRSVDAIVTERCIRWVTERA